MVLMKKLASPCFLFLLLMLGLLSSCDKGYQVRITNYSTESLDSVSIGNNQLVFTNIARQTASNYMKLKKGTYPITCVTQSKKHYSSSISIDKTGSGKRSIQVDGAGAINILED